MAEASEIQEYWGFNPRNLGDSSFGGNYQNCLNQDSGTDRGKKCIAVGGDPESAMPGNPESGKAWNLNHNFGNFDNFGTFGN